MSFGAQYDGKAAFTEFQGDIKGVQNKFREGSEVSMHALGQIAVSFSGELAGSIRFTVGLMEELFKGGVWGIMAAGINLVVTSLVNWHQETQSAAKNRRRKRNGWRSASSMYCRRQ